MKSLSKVLVLAAVILVSGLTMSCEKEEDLPTGSNTIETDPNVQMEIVDLETEDWDYIGEGIYQASIESANIGTKSNQVKVYYKLSKEELGPDGIWKELPYEGFKFTLTNSQVLINRMDNCDPNCTFKIEVYQSATNENMNVEENSLHRGINPGEHTF